MIRLIAKSFRHLTCLIAMVALLVPLARAQHRSSEDSARVQGKVCDPQNHPLVGATVSLESSDLRQTFVANTDSQGHYNFAALPSGTYILRANLPGYGEQTKGPLVLKQHEAIKVDLQLEPEAVPKLNKGTGQAVEFSDEPEFTVASVTDPSNLGGHGSDVVLRTKETLAKDTVSLNREVSGGSNAAVPISKEAKSSAEAGGDAANGYLEDKRRGKLLVKDGKPEQALS